VLCLDFLTPFFFLPTIQHQYMDTSAHQHINTSTHRHITRIRSTHQDVCIFSVFFSFLSPPTSIHCQAAQTKQNTTEKQEIEKLRNGASQLNS
jgi:hypothetical protein